MAKAPLILIKSTRDCFSAATSDHKVLASSVGQQSNELPSRAPSCHSLIKPVFVQNLGDKVPVLVSNTRAQQLIVLNKIEVFWGGGKLRNKLCVPNACIQCFKINISEAGYPQIPFLEGEEHQYRSTAKEWMAAQQEEPRPWQAFTAGIFSLYFFAWNDSCPAWLERRGTRLGSLTIAVKERKHHIAHMIRELHLGHRPGHLLHCHCNGGRAEG